MSIHPVIIICMLNNEMPWQITYLACHCPRANNVYNEAVLLIARGGRDHCILLEMDLAPGATHFMRMACPAIFISLCPNDIDLYPHQMLSKECVINDWMLDHGHHTRLGGSSDNIVLLGLHHVSCPDSDSRSTPQQNLVPVRILSTVVGTGKLLPSLIGGGTFPTLLTNLVEW